MYRECLMNVRPKLKLFKDYIQAKEAVAKLRQKLYPNLLNSSSMKQSSTKDDSGQLVPISEITDTEENDLTDTNNELTAEDTSEAIGESDDEVRGSNDDDKEDDDNEYDENKLDDSREVSNTLLQYS